MPSQSNSPSLADLLSDLEAAVRTGERDRAFQLADTILQRLATETANHAVVERQVRVLIAALDGRESFDLLKVDFLEPERSGMGPSDDSIDESGDAVPRQEGVVYPVWFGTNRQPTAAGGWFTGERHDRTTLGRALVRIPKTHRFGETGNGIWTRLFRFQFRGDRLRLEQVEERNQNAFFSELRAEMKSAQESGDLPHALIYIHGFNVTFEQAAIRAAQIGVDLKVPGAMAFFSWPSRGSVASYAADEATIEASERAITAFLVNFTANCGADKVHVIAHSMGNRGFLRALQRVAADPKMSETVKFGQIFLAAPDIDRDVFLDLSEFYTRYSERTTLYASDADKPVHLSSKLHGAPRAGYFTPYTVAPDIDTVAVPDFNVDSLGHGYFSNAEALLYDISTLIRHGASPAHRTRVKEVTHDGAKLWELVR